MGLDTDSEAGLATLVTFTYGAGSITRYTSFADPITIGGDTWLPEPSTEVTLNAQGGGSDDTPAQLRMLIRSPLDTLTSQRCHSPVRVLIEEVDPTDLSTRTTLFGGIVKMSERNLDGKTGIVQIEIAGWRYSLEVFSNAWLADTTCNNVFGDVVCTIDLSTKRQSGTITALSGNQVTISGLTMPGTITDYWRFGCLSFDGLAIKVTDQTSGSDLVMLKTPPASWLGQVVTATPGCDKRLATCRDRWSNEARFTGFGLKIPAYNPLLEST